MDINKIKSILPLQNSLRDFAKLPFLVDDIKSDKIGTFNINSYISLTHFVSMDRYLVHDGHHRLTAYILANVDVPEHLISIKKYTVKDYLSVNFKDGWTTPINPFINSRRCDLSNWRKLIEQKCISLNDKCTEDYIYSNFQLYSLPKRFFYMNDFAEQYKNMLL